jgi:ribosomal protein L11 methyltransferase
MKKFNRFLIFTKPFQPDLVSGILWELNISGINIEDEKLVVYSSEDSQLSEAEISKKLTDIKNNNLIETFEIQSASIENKNWNEEWEKGIEVQRISERIVIKPSFRQYKEMSGEIVITIDPKMSFGTGEHETTRLMLRLLEKYLMKDSTLLDAGTGTGILAIAASKLGAREIVALDNDEWSIQNSKENIQLNNVNNVRLMLGELENLKDFQFDMIVANINKNILIDIKDETYRLAADGGSIIFSGFLRNDVVEIRKEYEKFGFEVLDEMNLNEWSALVFRSGV